MKRSRRSLLSCLLSLALVLCNLTFTVVADAEGDEITALELDTEYAVSIADWSDKWFSYTPEEDGNYVFSATGGDAPYAYIYDEDGYATYMDEGWAEELNYGDGEFNISATFNAGETYYFRTSSWLGVDEYTVVLLKQKTVDSISVLSGVTETFTMDDSVAFNGTKIEITYTDGESAEIELEYNGQTDSNSCEGIYYNVYSEDGDEFSSDTVLPAGSYYVVFSVGDALSEKYDFTVTESDSVMELIVDTEKEYTTATEEWCEYYAWFSFTPEESGDYAFTLADISFGYVSIYIYSPDGLMTEDFYYNGYSDDGSYYTTCSLEEGNTYYIRISSMAFESGNKGYTAMMSKLTEITGISVDESLLVTEYEFGDDVSFEGTCLRLEYANNTSAEFTLESNYQTDATSGKEIYYIIYNDDEEEISYGGTYLASGTYTVVFYAGDCKTDAYEITVNELDEVTELTLGESYTGSLAYKECDWYSYTPDETDSYIFYVTDDNANEVFFWFYDEYDKSGWGSSDGEMFTNQELTAGKTYYYSIVGCEDSNSYSLSFYKPLSYTDISISSAETEFTTEEEVDFSGTVLTFTYSDNTSVDFTLDYNWKIDTATGENIYYAIYDSNDWWISYEPTMLDAGAYKVVFYAGDYSAEAEITVSEPVSVESIAVADTYTTEFSMDEVVSFDETVLSVGYSDSTATEVVCDESDDITYSIYDESGEYVSDGGEALYAGTYYVVFSYGDIESSQYEFTVETSENIISLTLDTAEAAEETETSWFSFTPTEDGDYLFKVYDITAAEMSIKVYAGDTNIESHSYADGEFDADEGVIISISLEAGTTYSINVTGDSAESSYTVMMTETSAIESMAVSSLVSDSFTMDEYVAMTGTKLTVTYENGTTGTLSFTYDVDSASYDATSGQYISYVITDTDGSAYNGSQLVLMPGTYSIYFYVMDTDIVSNIYEIEVTESADITEITLNTEYTVDVSYDEWIWYSFTPTVSGTYEFKSYDSDGCDPCMYLYNEDGYVETYDPDGGFDAEIEMTAGETYYFMVCGSAQWPANYHVILTNTAAVESVSVKTISASEFSVFDEVSFDGTTLEITYDDGNTYEMTLSENGEEEPGTLATVSYEIFDENGDSVSAGETLPAGTYTVVFYAGDVESAATEFTVEKEEAALTATVESSNIDYGETSQITVTTDSTGTVSYSSSDTSIATVDSTGLITAVGLGTATIEVTAEENDDYNEATETLTVTVVLPEQAVDVVEADIEEYGSNAVIIADENFEGEFFESAEGQAFIENVIDPLNSGDAELADVIVDAVSVSDGSAFDLSSYELLTDVFDLKVKVNGELVEDVENIEVAFNIDSVTSDMTIIVLHYNTEDGQWEVYDDAAVDGTMITVTFSSLSPVAIAYKATPDYTLGDVNQDGDVDSADAMMVLRYDSLLISLDEAQLLAGDVNFDGVVDSEDAVLILRYDAQLITSFE